MAAVKLGDTTTNRKFVPTAEETLEKACDCDGMCVGGILPSFGAANKVTKTKKNKIRRGPRWPPFGKKSHNNQPKTGGRNGGDYGGEARRAGGTGKHDIIVFWRGEV